MKIIKLLTPIFTLATTTSVVMPLVACNKNEHKDPVDPTKIVDVKVVNTDEYVKLDKEQAEKGKRFEAHVNYVCSFALDSIIVKNGEKALTPDEDFTFSYITHLLVIKEGVITDTISIQLEFSYVTVDIAKYRTYGHGENMISADAINVTNSEREFTLYMNLDYSNWPSANFPNLYDVQTEDTVIPNYATIISCSCIYADGIGADKDENNVTIDRLADTPNVMKMTLTNGAQISTDSNICLEIKCKFPLRRTNYRFVGWYQGHVW